MIGNHIGCSICCGAGYTINGDVCKCGSAERRLTMNTGPVVLSNELNKLRAENERLKASLAEAKKEIEMLPNPNQLLADLVDALNATHWSSWQSMATFANQLQAAEIYINAIKEIEK